MSGPFTYDVELPPVILAGNVPVTVTELAVVDVKTPEVNANVVQAMGLSRITPLVLLTVNVPIVADTGNSNPVVILEATVGAV